MSTAHKRPASTAKDVLELAAAHRAKLQKKHRVRNSAGLVSLVDDFGFCFAFTLRPGDAPIPACFDHLSTNDEGRKWGWMWEWKDELAESRRLYYGSLLVRKPTFVSTSMLPVFYATFGRAGEPDDHLEDVRAGRLSDLGRRIIEFLAQHGETQTKRIRTELGILSKEGRRDYDRAIDEVQRLMYVARARAVGETREDYNYTYDLFVTRHPEACISAEALSSADAVDALLDRALNLAGAVSVRQLSRLFEWDDERIARAISRFESANKLVRMERGREVVLALPALAA